MNKDEARQTIGKIIRIKRRRKNISQKELAEAIGVTKSSISRYEKALMEIPASVLPLICEKCEFPFSEFFKSTDVNEAVRYYETNIRPHTTTKSVFNEYQKAFYDFLLSDAGMRAYSIIDSIRQVEKVMRLPQNDFFIRTLSQEAYNQIRNEILCSAETRSKTQNARLLSYFEGYNRHLSD